MNKNIHNIRKRIRILRDNIQGINKVFMFRIAREVGLSKYQLNDEDISPQFQKWTENFLEKILDKFYGKKDNKCLFLKDIQVDVKYSFGEEDYYDKLLSLSRFKRLVCEMLQNYIKNEQVRVANDGVIQLRRHYVENALRLFYTIKLKMNMTKHNKRVTVINVKYFNKGIKYFGQYEDPKSDSDDYSDEDTNVKPKKVTKKCNQPNDSDSDDLSDTDVKPKKIFKNK